MPEIPVVCASRDHWFNMIVDGECHTCGGAFKTFCPQCRTLVKDSDFDPRAGMCGSCISEAMAEVPEFFGRRGLVESVEEHYSND